MVVNTIDLLKEFGSTKLESDALAEGQSICQTFDLSANDLFIRWQSYLINQCGGDVRVQPTRERLLEVRAAIQQEHERKMHQRRNGAGAGIGGNGFGSQVTKLSRNKERAHYDKKSVEGLLQGMVSGSQREPMRTPQSTKIVGLLQGSVSAVHGRAMFSPMSPSVFAEPSPSALRYSKRTNTGRTEDSLRSEMPPLKLPEGASPVVASDLYVQMAEAEVLSSDESGDEAGDDKSKAGRPRPMRYMFEKMSTRTEIINKRIERTAIDTKAEYKIEALANPTYAHQETVTAVGRILNIGAGEGDSGPTPISSETLFLETSRRLGNGRRVSLDVRSTPSYSLFPGQVVAVEGKNLKGSEFSVSQFRQLPRLPHLSIGEREHGIEPFGAVIAAGPYTLSDNLDYEPLADLVNHAIAAAPGIVFLLGPFVSENHPMIRDGQIDMLPEELFSAKISPQLQRLREALPASSSIYLVPSTDEMCYPYVSYPQPAFSRDLMNQLGVPAGVGALSNPAQVSVNGVVFAVANIDILFHLVKEEVSRLPAPSDRLPRLAWHLVEQRHLYPLSPPPLECAGILASHDSKLRMQAMPDILITPSQLKHFVRAHENVVLLNPGHSSMRMSGGTFAKISVHPQSAVEAGKSLIGDSAKAFPADLTSAEIVRI
ncbi:DNA-directed DNA polymerase alpha subunit pol12 [Kickxella alabastrina]|uniref:DNA-directed DNA polymerase alpha subunit pol12 n=1 Tax=Kickxella alabastrina TaxID=61397 RepID=A0ACC1IH42_9FUNG|nr:DNA-directed DNA polymerase alpha subunit pol12 [Kickxella alabastrina]